MSTKITEETIKAMKPPASGNRIVWDSEVKGFGVRITATGALSFLLDYRIHGKHPKIAFARPREWKVSDARDRAIELKKMVDEGIDPQEEKRALSNQPNFSELLDDYLESGEFRKKRPSTAREYRRLIEAILRPKLGKLRLQAIGRRDIEVLHADLKETAYQANRVLALISVLFNYAMEAEWVTANPAAKVERYPEDHRERYLSQDELGRLSTALDNYRDQDAANVIRLLIYTGARFGEVINLTWEQLDLESGVWRKASHHTKQKKQTETPLHPDALDLLCRMRPVHAKGRLFQRLSIKRPWAAVSKAAGLVEEYEEIGQRGKPLKRYRPVARIHDLRHSFISHLVLAGVPLRTAGALAGHTQVATTQRYSNLTREDLREAVGKFPKVVTMAKRPA